MKRRFLLIIVISAGIHLALLAIRFQQSGGVPGGRASRVALVAANSANFVPVGARAQKAPVEKERSFHQLQPAGRPQDLQSRLQSAPKKVAVSHVKIEPAAVVPDRLTAGSVSHESPEPVEQTGVVAANSPSPRNVAVAAIQNAEKAQVDSDSQAKNLSRAEEGGRPVVALVHAVPRYADNPRPAYPEVARRKGWTGEVQLLVRVAATGGVDRISVHRSSGYSALDRAARRAVRLWRFVPASEAGRKVSSDVLIPIDFRLPAGAETGLSGPE